MVSRTSSNGPPRNYRGALEVNLKTCAKGTKLRVYTWIYDRIEQGEDMKIGDVTEDEKKHIWKMVIVALWCAQMKPMDRPSMSKALDMLDGDVELLELPPKPTLYSHEISALDRENKPMGVQISSHNASITISLDGR
ncbi:Leaf rust 10 disease-resistance locus receptor-like protein kinase-like 1.1-like 2.1 [Vitis vinifera]|uniref:Leaf rust 10 disease-resistance locus receptor-like protein kinase-like 1.1-like 2.1 n=1 Tax=Vitis vinifera TaxID=29760 RepID=A0A438DJQ7_VITVI|nr:Leaf rust 10 disease-resistance locus receptor-like protein kinase-like 1.1-like 2.1 [Vitis vinifera]